MTKSPTSRGMLLGAQGTAGADSRLGPPPDSPATGRIGFGSAEKSHIPESTAAFVGCSAIKAIFSGRRDTCPGSVGCLRLHRSPSKASPPLRIATLPAWVNVPRLPGPMPYGHPQAGSSLRPGRFCISCGTSGPGRHRFVPTADHHQRVAWNAGQPPAEKTAYAPRFRRYQTRIYDAASRLFVGGKISSPG